MRAAVRADGLFAFVRASVDFSAFRAAKNGVDAPPVAQNAFPPLINQHQKCKKRKDDGDDYREKNFDVDLIHII